VTPPTARPRRYEWRIKARYDFGDRGGVATLTATATPSLLHDFDAFFVSDLLSGFILAFSILSVSLTIKGIFHNFQRFWSLRRRASQRWLSINGRGFTISWGQVGVEIVPFLEFMAFFS
jgi:hypothetical protein